MKSTVRIKTLVIDCPNCTASYKVGFNDLTYNKDNNSFEDGDGLFKCHDCDAEFLPTIYLNEFAEEPKNEQD